jgi:hypothetical protein
VSSLSERDRLWLGFVLLAVVAAELGLLLALV